MVIFISLSGLIDWPLHLLLLWFFLDTCINFTVIIVLWSNNNSWDYTWCKRRTIFFTLEERVIANLFQFWITNEMKILISILDLILEGRSSEMMILVVSIPWFYPFNIIPMQLELPVITMFSSFLYIHLDIAFFLLLLLS